jgi:hypothetical protein
MSANRRPHNYSSTDWYTSANYGVSVQDALKRPILYTHDGKPLARALPRVGFGTPPPPTETDR